ncbi:F-box protein PP2-A13 [Acorus gramineus]|uniref:F-box protein PP2-A13 n=1 Tax=Acorus gramineus TaxID=55184 RepID=A0AAV9B9M2_ACOGR|nr:F-box protein PP2-A13 [Acorus gramineus]
MGAGISSFAAEVEAGNFTGLGDIPEGCVAAVLVHLNPVEICGLARLNRAFRGASSANFVWDSKLPVNYRYLLGVIGEDDRLAMMTKKEIYARLSRHNSFDGGTKEMWLQKSTGGLCLLISSKALSITGIDDRRYWNHIPTEGTRFRTVAYLQQIWWFEVVGEIEFCFPPGTYSLFFRLQLGRPSRRLGRRTCNIEHIHGWDLKPVKFQLSTSDGQHALSHIYLDEPGAWFHYHVGDFVVTVSDKPTRVKFSMIQIDCTHTKGGVCIDSVLICPSRPAKERSLVPNCR